jgi:WD40 repeat protein/tetratricopeptide (TPR) repeat protein
LSSGTVWIAWSPDGATLALPRSDITIDLWEAATGIRKVTLEGSSNAVVNAGFHPAGTLLASNGWENRLRLWDTVLGQPILSLTGSCSPTSSEFSRDGRIVVSVEDQLITYQVDPALEYRTFAHASAQREGYRNASIRRDGRVLALPTDGGVALWDLARGAELPFLPIGWTWYAIFEPSGDLLTLSTGPGVQRWPIELDPSRRIFRIGPPRQFRLPRGVGICEDQTGTTIAMAVHDYVVVMTPELTSRLGPLDDVRSVALSPDGEWLATGSFQVGAQIRRLGDDAVVAELPVGTGTTVQFSRDGKWLMTTAAPCQLWAVGGWSEAGQKVGGAGLCFSEDGRMVVVKDESRVLRLVETNTGRTLANFESPDLCDVWGATFSPDGSRLAVVTNDGPAVHVWDLRAIRRRLGTLGLDWDAPAFADLDPAAPSAQALPPLRVDLGWIEGYTEHFLEAAETLKARYTARLAADPNDALAYDHRGRAELELGQTSEAAADFTRAIRLRPQDMHLIGWRGASYGYGYQFEPAIADLEVTLAHQTEQPCVRELLSEYCNDRSRELTSAPGLSRDSAHALDLARRATELAPANIAYRCSLGIAQFRACRYSEAVATLEQSLTASKGRLDGINLFFLAMAHHRQGNPDGARAYFDRAVQWLGRKKSLSDHDAKELAVFRAEAENVLAGPAGELPADVFARP